MSDGHGDGGGCGTDSPAMCAEPVAGSADAGIVSPAAATGQIINGVEINRAAILEKAKERLLKATDLTSG